MSKVCRSCGSDMDLTLRTVFFKKVIEVKNVPVFTCSECENHELINQVKGKVKKVISNEKLIKRKVIPFEKYSDFAQLVVMAYNQQENPYHEERIQEEINDLIETFVCEEQVGENTFEQKAHKKLERFIH